MIMGLSVIVLENLAPSMLSNTAVLSAKRGIAALR